MGAEFIQAFFYAFGLLFLAELGDKTQLIILTLSSKGHSSKKLAIGATLGFAVIVILGGIIAKLLSNNFELPWITFVSGIIFIILGIIQIISLIREKKYKENDEGVDKSNTQVSKNKRGDLSIGFIAIVSMEMGDKTQVATVLLASVSSEFVATLLGAWIALSLLAGIGAYAGLWLSKKVPKTLIDWIASFLFLLIGIIMCTTAF